MSIFNSLKNIFFKKYIDENKNKQLLEKQDDLCESKKKSVDQELKILKRKKYTNCDINFENKFKYRVLDYLLSRESSSFCVYWDVYIPIIGTNDYIKIDNLVVTGDTIYIIDCNEYVGCLNIDVKNDKWKCVYNNGSKYDNTNQILKNYKNIDIIKKYIKSDSYNLKSIVVIMVEDEFFTDMNNDELIILRKYEWEILFKILDKRIKSSKCEGCINREYVSINNKLYNCMNNTKKF